MKFSIVTILSVTLNVLLTKGQSELNDITNEYPDFTQALTFKSILEDINNFYSQNYDERPIIANPNIKAQVSTIENDSSLSSYNAEENNGENNGENMNTTNQGDINNFSDNSNNNNNNNIVNDNGNGNVSNGDMNNNGNGISNDVNNGINNNNNVGGDLGDNGNDEGNDEEVTEIGDYCGNERDSWGMFAFRKPDKKSVVVMNSNFTIIWYYNKIREGFTYNYPSNITFKLYYEEDSNPNVWNNPWDKHVFERTVPLSECQEGPSFNGIRTQQYNWEIIPDVEHGFIQNARIGKYRLRIYGDNKDVQSNSNFECYADGDIYPALTNPFYIVENNRITDKYYNVIEIDDDARMNAKVSLLFTFIISLFLAIYNHW